MLVGSSNAIFRTTVGGGSAGAWSGADLEVLSPDGSLVRGRGYSGLVAERIQFSRNKRGRGLNRPGMSGDSIR